ncbi:MAG: NYN domain-containing protein [Desulfarculaceae bacterium]|jgi:hypothetical protein
MHLVIDGYNLIHATADLSLAQDRDQGPQALTAALKLYRQKRGHKVTVVLDGGPDPQGGQGSLNQIPLIYSGADRSADQVIIEMARRHGPGITVISNDNQLTNLCQQAGAEVISSFEFSDLLMEAALESHLAGEGDDRPGWDFSTKKKGPSRRLPKAKRRRQRRLKRL